MNAQPMSFGFVFWLNWLFAYMGGNLLSVQILTHTHSNDNNFHHSDKMPNNVEMVWTKCQPKSWDRQNANHINKSGQNTNLWLALCPVGILSGWHFVCTPSASHPFVRFSCCNRIFILDFCSASLDHWNCFRGAGSRPLIMQIFVKTLTGKTITLEVLLVLLLSF